MKYKDGFISSSSSNSFITADYITVELVVSKNKGLKNNDGRDSCFKCGEPTEQISNGFMNTYCTCKNPNCEWYKN